MSFLKIAGGTVYDPLNNLDGVVRDIWIRDGKIIAEPTEPDARPDKIIDATGLIVMPGGVDMHAHIAGPKVNLARKMRPEDKRKAPVVRRTPRTRSGTTGSVPSTFATGYLYAGMGYTTAFDAAIPPLSTRHAHEEFHDTPILDKGFFLLFGNNHYVLKQIAANEPERLRAFVAWLLSAGYLSSCDVPFLQPAFVRRLIALLGEHIICVPEVGGYRHPLAAVYRVEAAAAAARLLTENRLRPLFLFEEVPTRIVRPEELIDADPTFQTLRNLNTPAEYEAALRDSFAAEDR